MPVATINLQRDDRWGSLGAGLGALLGSTVQAMQKRQATEGVAQIWSDPAVPPDQKLIRSLQRYGDMGGEVGLQLLKAQTMAEQLRNMQSEEGLRASQGRLAEARAGLVGAQAPLAGPLAQGKLNLQQAETLRALAGAGKEQAETAFTQGPRTQAERELGGQRNLEQQKIGAELPKIQAQAAIEQQQAKVMKDAQSAASNTMGHPLDIPLSGMPSLSDEQKASLKSNYNFLLAQGVKPSVVAAQVLKDAATRNQGTILPDDIRKQVESKAEGASAAKIFLESFEKSPKTGLFAFAPFKAWLEGQGAGTGDAVLLKQYDTQLRLTADNLSAGGMGGGFMSQIRLKFAGDLAPSLRDSPLRNIINLDVMATSTLAGLRASKANVSDKYIQKGLDQTIQAWEDIKAETSKYHTYITPKGDTVLTHSGDALNAKNFSRVITGGRLYSKGNDQVRGSDIVTLAEEAGMTPQDYARTRGISIGAAGGARNSAPLP